MGKGAESVILNENLMNTIIRVNTEVNRRIKPRADIEDIWTLNPPQGDCEDYAITKRAALMAKGFPSNALRIGLGKAYLGESHAVLLVNTDRGVLVLDNLERRVLLKSQSRMSFSRVSKGDLTDW